MPPFSECCVVAGDDGCEAYTANQWSGLLSRESNEVAEAETVENVEGNMLRTVMRGATALPWSETPLRWQGRRRNLGDLNSPATATAIAGHDGASKRRSHRGRDEGSDGGIVLMKPTNKTGCDAGGGEGGGKASGRGEGRQRRVPRTQSRIPHETEAASLRVVGNGPPKPPTTITFHFRQEPGAGKPHAGICAGGPGQPGPLPLPL
jgi:hypothetical protein